jgi:hypothetical protein
VEDNRWEERREECKEKHVNGNGFGLTLGMAVQLAGWPTPNVPNGGRATSEESMTSRGQTPDGKKRQVDLRFVAGLTGWASPCCRDSRGAHDEKTLRQLKENGHQPSLLVNQANLAGWTTPQANEPESPERRSRAATGRTTEFLGRQAQGVSGWVTPAARDYKGDSEATIAKGPKIPGGCRLPGNAQLASLSPARTVSGAGCPRLVLNPAFSLVFLMGFPLSWLLCGRKAIRSFRSRRRKKDG